MPLCVCPSLDCPVLLCLSDRLSYHSARFDNADHLPILKAEDAFQTTSHQLVLSTLAFFGESQRDYVIYVDRDLVAVNIVQSNHDDIGEERRHYANPVVVPLLLIVRHW